MATQDFLVELGTEELPPKALKPLSDAFTQGIARGLEEAGIEFGKVEAFAAPRRLAVRIRDLADSQPDKSVEKRGPAVKAAFDDAGNPTRALTGFATSLGVTPDQLDTLETDKGAWVVYRTVEQGKPTVELMPELVEQSLAGLPIPKRMRWGAHRTEFVRPVHWVVMLFGNKVIEAPIMGLTPGNKTRGHRFHCPKSLIVPTPNDYEVVLKQEGYVIADFAERREQIRAGVTELAEKEAGGKAVIDEGLLDEVTALNEWPVPLMGRFEERFLEVPAEALISSMKEHQKYFHVVAADGEMLPLFITVANIESKDPSQVVSGNEKVIRPRLSDAAFFYETDRKTKLGDRIDALKPIVFQEKLGSIYDKSVRVAALAKKIADAIGSDPAQAERAAMLAKTDLVTEMVLEFTDLQGIMGQYYAANDGEPEDVAKALNEQYMPRFAGDDLPTTLTGCAIAIADRLDSLVGLFGINQPPSGTRDPFALRRASLGVLRIIIERELPLDLQTCCEWAEENFTVLADRAEHRQHRGGLYAGALPCPLRRTGHWRRGLPGRSRPPSDPPAGFRPPGKSGRSLPAAARSAGPGRRQQAGFEHPDQTGWRQHRRNGRRQPAAGQRRKGPRRAGRPTGREGSAAVRERRLRQCPEFTGQPAGTGGQLL